MTFSFRALLVFTTFLALLAVGVDPPLGAVPLAAALAIELFTWAPVCGAGRGDVSLGRCRS